MSARPLAWAVQMGAIAVAFVAGYGFQEIRGHRRLEAAEARLAALAAERARVDTIYARDSVTVWRLKRSADTLTVTVDQWKRDTVRVVEYVERADSTIRACSQLVLTCERRVVLRDSTIAQQERRWEARERPRHPLLIWGERGLIFWLGTQVR